MKKLEGRAILCLTLALALVLGLFAFIYKLVKNGDDWASFYANQHIYSGGQLSVGAVYDRNGLCLLENDKDGSHYVDDAELRKATLHVVGDVGYNITTAANNAFRSKMIGYNLVTGTNDLLFSSDRKVTLTIDAELNKAAYNALAGRNGFVSVYNWKTGEIVCLVSMPTVDPSQKVESSSVQSGTYINKVLSATYTPGSTFKLVTTAAAIENIDGIDEWSFECTGSYTIGSDKITCSHSHGKVDLYSALAKSCNCAYAYLTVELGADMMNRYVDELGLTSQYNIDGIKTAQGNFNFDTYDINLGWAGVGQFEDQINPLSMMVYMGAIAGGGSAAEPHLIKEGNGILGSINIFGKDTVNLLSEDTANQLKDMMRNNVEVTYGDGNYPGLELHAKSGTAENGGGKTPNSWFCGFSGDYAFIVCVENGGSGAAVAGPVANKVLQAVNTRLVQQ